MSQERFGSSVRVPDMFRNPNPKQVGAEAALAAEAKANLAAEATARKVDEAYFLPSRRVEDPNSAEAKTRTAEP